CSSARSGSSSRRHDTGSPGPSRWPRPASAVGSPTCSTRPSGSS
ncbi:MAG: hypothetical protein AVDCRST_MAG79-457, partial [uncultured Thermoleophilia bacterium]